MNSKKEVLTYLLKRVEEGKPFIIVCGTENKKLAKVGVNSFCPEQYSNTIRHLGFGLFEGRTPEGRFSFLAGGAMFHYQFPNGEWLSISPISTENKRVLKALNYPFETVKEALKEEIAKL